MQVVSAGTTLDNVLVTHQSPAAHRHDAHQGAGHHEEPAEWADQLRVLERDGQIGEPWLAAAIDWLAGLTPAPVRRLVDIGAGPGVAATLFAEALPHAEVVAFDPSPVLLERAQQRARERGLLNRFHVKHGSVGADLAGLERADLLWCSRVLHHLPDPGEGIAQLAQVLTDDGLLAIAEGGLPMRFLPGGYGVAHAGFVSRLDAALADFAQEKWEMTDAAVGGDRDWPLVIADAGLEHLVSRTFVLDLPAPLDGAVRDYVVDRFAELPEKIGARLDETDARALSRLNDPSDPAALVNRPDLFLLTAYTVHVGRRRSAPEGRTRAGRGYSRRDD